MLSLALELQRRQHKIALFYYTSRNINIAKINNLGIETIFVGSPNNEKLIIYSLKDLSSLLGGKANKQTIRIYEILAEINFCSLPQKIRAAECDALLIDQTLFEGESIASLANLPFINICNALILNPDVELPPSLIAWQPKCSFLEKIRNNFKYLPKLYLLEKIRNICGYMYIGWRFGNTTEEVREYRKEKKLPAYPSYFNGYFKSLWSPIATITQQPIEFEFERSMNRTFYFTGPFINPDIREYLDFPWEKLDGRPLIYASIGTLQNSVDNIYSKIARACLGIDCQLFIALGKKEKEIKIDRMPSNTIVTSYAPQLELLQKASLCITHAGINTVLESLSYGVPMVAIPIANDQPGVAARIEYTGTGIVLSRRCKSWELKKAIATVLNSNLYKENALKMQNNIREKDGLKYAADIIESAISPQ